MNFLKSTVTIIVEIIIIILSSIWYNKTKEIEPLIGIVASIGGLLASIFTKFSVRPRILLHHQKTHWGRMPRGYTSNSPTEIRLGIDLPEQYWELVWHFDLEIRNNSSLTAYNISIQYENLPQNTLINGTFGKIEPLPSNEIRIFEIRLVQIVVGTHLDADKFKEEIDGVLTKDLIVRVSYQDENGFAYNTKYIWSLDKNILYSFKDSVSKLTKTLLENIFIGIYGSSGLALIVTLIYALLKLPSYRFFYWSWYLFKVQLISYFILIMILFINDDFCEKKQRKE